MCTVEKSKIRNSCIKCCLKKRYKLTEEEIVAILAPACCSACGAREDLCIDHDHATGTLRELLCRKCNTVLGLSEDSPKVLMCLIEYLYKHRKRGP